MIERQFKYSTISTLRQTDQINDERYRMSSFHLFTSVKPPASATDIAYLRDCLNSWRDAGFTAVAVNGPREAEALRRLDLGIEFAPLSRDGKPRLCAIFSAIRESGATFSGIINSDCRIIKYPNFAANLKASLHKAVVLGWRIDLGSDFKPTKRRGGFDAFFFDTDVIPQDDYGFSIAEPWWDYWFPLACEMSGARIETLTLPLLTHKYHPENWSEQSFVNAGRRVWSMLESWHQRGDLPNSLLERMPAGLRFGHIPSNEQLRRLVAVPPFWFFECRPQTSSVMDSEAVEIEMMLRYGGRSLFNEVKFAKFDALLNSTFWHMTEPLLRAVIRLKRLSIRG
jgi:hypothetical protein